MKSQEFVPQIKHPNSLDLHWRDEAPKHVALKIKVACVQENHRDIKNEDFTLKGLMETHLPQHSIQKHQFEEYPEHV